MKSLTLSLLFALLNITNPLFGVERVLLDIEANKVTILSLQNQEIRDTDIKAIALALEKNTSLTTLYLSDNQIGDVGAQAIALALEKNTSLTQLDLGLNQIGDNGAKALATALEKNTSL